MQAFLLQAKQQRGRTLKIEMMVVLSKQNLHELGDILHLAKALGFGHILVLDPIPVDEVAMALCPSAAEISAAGQELIELADDAGLNVTCWFRQEPVPPKAIPHCLQPWEYMFIRANGDVAPCCAVFGSERGVTMGNVLEESFETIWLGEPYRKFRSSSVSGTNDLCRICPYY